MKLSVNRTAALLGMIVVCIGAATWGAFGATSARSVATEYKRLLAIAVKLKKIPVDRQDREPNKSYLKLNKKDIVYSEPAGEWFVRADRFWTLSKRAKPLPIADDIAWTAAQTPLPGECEGDINCNVYNTNATLGEYLRMFPNGKHSKQALSQFVEWTSPMVNDPDAKTTYVGPTDAADKGQLRKMITELRNTFAKVGARAKESVSLLNKLAETYK